MLLGVILLSLNDALIKSLTLGYPVGQLLFIRGLFVCPWILILAHRAGGMRSLRVINVKGQAWRGICVIAGSFLFVIGLRYLPLADAIAITFTGPLFITVMAPYVLGERVGWRRRAAVLAGFLGVLIMARPGGGALQWAVLLPLGGALCGGVRDLITRRIARSETTCRCCSSPPWWSCWPGWRRRPGAGRRYGGPTSGCSPRAGCWWPAPTTC